MAPSSHKVFPAMDPDNLLSKYMILVSPVGKMYLIDDVAKVGVGSYILQDSLDNKIYEAKQKSKVDGYMDAYVNKSGEIRLRHHSSSHAPPEEIQLISYDQVRRDITSYFGDKVTILPESRQRVKLCHEWGEHFKTRQGIVDIAKTDYEIITSEWRLRFSNYQASFVYNDQHVLPIVVYHTHEVEAFSNKCHSMGIFDESMKYDIWILQNLTSETVNIENNPMDSTSNVFRGSMKGSLVFVKLLPRSCIIPLKVQILWSSKHDNFSTFLGVQIHGSSYHFIFEHCKYTLNEYLLKREADIRKRQRIMRDLVDGLIYQHERGLCHANWNSWSVMVTDNGKPKISGFDLIPSTNQLLDGNRPAALGNLITHLYSNLDCGLTRQTRKRKYMEASQSPWAYEARDIAKKLLGRRPPSLDEVSLHPSLWSSEKHIHFYIDVTALLEPDTDSNKHYREEMYWFRHDYFGFFNWEDGVPRRVFEQQKKRSKYNTNHPWDLLRFIRNIFCHLPGVLSGALLRSPDLKWLGSNTSVTEFCFRSKFPYFTTGLYDFIKEKVPKNERKNLEQYYYINTRRN